MLITCCFQYCYSHLQGPTNPAFVRNLDTVVVGKRPHIPAIVPTNCFSGSLFGKPTQGLDCKGFRHHVEITCVTRGRHLCFTWESPELIAGSYIAEALGPTAQS